MTSGDTQRRSGGVRAFMIADLRGYTSFTEQQGDEASAVLTERFADVARAVVEARDGTVVETRGDEVLAEFESPRASVRAALDLHLAIAGGDVVPLQAGIGLDVGEAVPVGDGFRGRAINMAARLCARAKPGETLVSPELAHLAGSIEGIVLEDGGPVQLKGFSRPVHYLIATPTVIDRRSEAAPTGGPVGCSILGPLEVTVGGRPVSVGSRKQRLVLAHLILRANRVVAMDELIDALWEDDPPSAARNTIQSYVSHLRAAIGTDRIESRAPGYLLNVETDQVDVLRFERALQRARRWVEVDPEQAISGIEEALHLWRGGPLSDLADAPSLVGEITRLEELRLSAIEDLFDAQLSVGDRDVVGELQPLVEGNPLRERLWGQLMLALYRAGRQGDALAAFDRARVTLSDELGIDPSPELRELHARILQQDPQLEITGRPLRSYRLIEQIGSGGYGIVWRAIDPTVGRDVAIKQIKPETASDPSFVRRFQQEVQVVARLEHPHIVPLYDVWRDGSGAFLVMRLLRGGSVADAIANGPLPRERAVAITSDVASALSAVHRHGLVHRDVKAENVLLDEDGNAYLADLGIAVDADRADVPTTSATDGSRSPEQIRGEPATALSDIFGLGRLLADMVGADPPSDVARVIERATAAEPSDRYPDVQSLVADLERATSVPRRPGTRTSTTERNPYKGLRPFSEADVDDFFGRDALVERLIERMREPPAASRFLALVGPSGSGKSSVVRAGLLPRLRAGAVPASDRWFFADMLPGARPMDELEGALLRAGVDPTVPLLDGLERDRGGLTSAIERILPPDDSQLLLFVDQFEEVFTLVDDDETRGRFLETLVAAVTDPSSRLRLVLTLRADFFDRPLAYPGVAELMRTRSETVVPLTAEELERAISGPAEQVGVVPELALVAEAVGDVTDQPGALPLLQYALTETFEARSDGVLTLEAYRATGGVTGALAKRAEQIYTAMHDEGREAARQLFLRLVSIGEGAEDTRRLVSRAEIASLEIDQHTMDAVIGAFGKHRLLSFDRDPDTRGPTVEVAHEALLRAWMRLRGWIDAARDDVIVHRRFTADVAGWERAGRDASFLMRGSRLAQIEGWAATTGLALATDEREFVAQSVRARDEEEAAEALRREHERALERRSVVRMRGLVAVLTAAVLVASVLTIVAIGQRQSSRDQARLATVRELSAAAEANVAIDPERSLLLGLRAIDATGVEDAAPETVQALHDALAADRLVMTLRDPSTANVAWSLDGRLIATGGSAGGKDQVDALIWDAFTGALLHRLSGHTADIGYVAFSPDSTRLVTVAGEADSRAIVWDVRDGTKLLVIPGLGGRDPAARFSPDGRSIVVQAQPTERAAWGSSGSLVRVVDANSGRERWRIVIGEGFAPPPLFSPDGSVIALCAYDGVHIVDATTHREIAIIDSQPSEMVFSPDGSELAAADNDHVGIWDLTTGSRHLTDPTLRVLAQKQIIGGLDWSADGQFLATGGGDGTARIFDAATGQQRLVLAGHTGGVALLAFNPGGTRLLTGGTDGTARIWDIRPAGTAEWFGDAEPYALSAATFTPDGSKVFTTGWQARDWFWDLSTGRRTAGYDGIWGDAAFSSDGRSLASVGDRIAIVEAPSGELIRELHPRPAQSEVRRLAYRPDGSLVALASSTYAALIDAHTGKQIASLGRPSGQIDNMNDVAFSPDGTLLAGISGLATTYVWDVTTHQELLRFQSQSGLATSVAFRPDGRSFATAGLDGATLWSTSGERLQTFTGVGHVDAIAFTSDGNLLATGGDDGLTHVWDVSTGQEVIVFRGPSDFVADVSFSPDGHLIVIAGADGTLWVDVLSVDRLVQIARSRLTRGFTTAECARYLHGEDCSLEAGVPAPTPAPAPQVSGPEGAFRIDVSPGDLPVPPLSPDDRFWNSGAFTFSFLGGSWAMHQQGSEPWLRDDWGGTYTSTGDRIRFTVERGDPVCRGEVWTARWSLDTASTLSFTAISAIEAATDPACGPPERATATVRAWLGSHPMTRVA